MREHIATAVRITLVLVVLVCGVYPFVVWAVGQVAFRDGANGSLLTRDGKVIGSSLIGQSFTSDRYFHSRPSAVDYNASASGGSNLGPSSRKLKERIEVDVAVMRTSPVSIPADAVTTSASGLDPHISPDNALRQVSRVARARGLDEAGLRAFVQKHVEGRFLGLYGQPRVNVLLLNLALDGRMEGHASLD